MRWFRSSRRPWGWLALLALALQLGLSFGHVHLAYASHPGLVATPAQNDAATPQPPDHEDDHESHYCAIYAINALLSGAEVAAPPVIPTPAAWAVADVSIATAVVRAGFRRPAFRSRAPPLS
jgi:hypothetical protein